MPPHSAKLPPKMGARFARSLNPPISLSLLGARYIPELAAVVTFAQVPDASG
jgi:hypothetical protein